MGIQDLIHKRGVILDEARAILDKAKSAGRKTLSTAEDLRFNELHSQADALGAEIRQAQADRNDATDRTTALPLGDSHSTLKGLSVLTPEQRMTDWHRQNIGGEMEERVSIGDVVAGLITGKPKNKATERALSVGTDAQGGFTAPSWLSAQWVDALRAEAVSIRAGARTIPLQSDENTLARLDTDFVAYWTSENTTITKADPAFTALTLRPKALLSHFVLSRQLAADSLNINDIVNVGLPRAMAVTLDSAVFNGSGTGAEPTGLANSTITNVSMGSNGAAFTNSTAWSKLFDAAYLMLANNAPWPGAAIMSPRTWNSLFKLTDSTFQGLQIPAPFQNTHLLMATSIPNNETWGSASATASRIWFGNFSECYIGIRSDIRIEILRERYADLYQYGVLAHMRADLGFAHTKSFSALTGIIL